MHSACYTSGSKNKKIHLFFVVDVFFPDVVFSNIKRKKIHTHTHTDDGRSHKVCLATLFGVYVHLYARKSTHTRIFFKKTHALTSRAGSHIYTYPLFFVLKIRVIHSLHTRRRGTLHSLSLSHVTANRRLREWILPAVVPRLPGPEPTGESRSS